MGNIRSSRRTKVILVPEGPTPLSCLIKSRREELGIRQNMFADLMGRSQPWICQVEQGFVWDLQISQVYAFADVLAIPAGQILAAAHQTYEELRKSSKGQVLIEDEVVGVRPGALQSAAEALSPEMMSRDQRATLGMGEFEQKRPEDPTTRWAGVSAVPIHAEDLPMADDNHEGSEYD